MKLVENKTGKNQMIFRARQGFAAGFALAITLAVLWFALGHSTAAAVASSPIQGLFNTGVDSSGTPLPDGTIGDPHYALISVPGGTTDIRVRRESGGFPIPPYLPDNSISAWIGPNNSPSLNGPVGFYTYRTTFSLAGFDASTATITGQWSSDNGGLTILLNGVDTGSPASPDFFAFTQFSITSGFVAGTNTLDFVVTNGDVFANPTALRVEMNGTADTDTDGDGVSDYTDNCPTTANPGQEDADGDAQGDVCDTDDDNDGVADGTDNCPFAFNPSQANNDGDALGDVCDNDDDNDGVLDGTDNCQFAANPNQANNDGDTQGDACDPDDDNDGVLDGPDNCDFTSNTNQANNDGDSMGDVCDPDDDNDGVLDGPDNCDFTSNSDQRDTNQDGVGDLCTPFQNPSGGQFVLGNLASMTGGTVNFWGSQWSQNNPMSGGSAPNSFKGFENGSAAPTCGQTWTSQPGNSSSPPSTVPLFMRAIVSSSITKNGSVITGNVKKVVIVQTNFGYGPSPGNAGTGKVIAILCSIP